MERNLIKWMQWESEPLEVREVCQIIGEAARELNRKLQESPEKTLMMRHLIRSYDEAKRAVQAPFKP